MVQQNPFFQDVFEADPTGRRSLFESYRPDDLLTNFQKDAFSGLFERIQNSFLGELGQQVRQGITPDLTFTDYLNQQDFGRQYRRAPVFETGRTLSPLRSAAQFLFNR